MYELARKLIEDLKMKDNIMYAKNLMKASAALEKEAFRIAGTDDLSSIDKSELSEMDWNLLNSIQEALEAMNQAQNFLEFHV